ncbi:helix-turn-helix transcriptional regulator [Neoroseomonas marina]|uniref:helix-turn-helix transcriptional regulator n=1 Tax=Neoroseomonas marina TaxID=1232220 RepID=UPI0030B9C58B
MTDTESLLTRAQAEKYLNLPPRTLERVRINGGGPPFMRVGARTHLYSRTDLDAWVQSIRSTPDA